MHIIKGQKGITLIALVITIIVMLILVGVTISVSLNGGLFSTAKEATDETQIAKEREELLIAALGTLNQNGEVDLSKLDSSLPEGFTGNNGQYTSKNGNVFTVTEDGTITLEGEPSEEEPDTPPKKKYTAIVTFNKTITYEPLTNTEITVYNDKNEVVTTYITDNEGKITFENDTHGYFVFKGPEYSYWVQLNEDYTVSGNFVEKMQSFYVGVSNASSMKVYDSNKVLQATLYPDANGQIPLYLMRVGTYYLQIDNSQTLKTLTITEDGRTLV